jgi:hypothetical protein
MARRIVAIVGTFRKGKIIDTAVAEILRGAREHGAETQTIYLLDRHFIERLLPYAWWPWAAKADPKYGLTRPDKAVVTVTSTACPAFIGRIVIPGSRRALKIAAQALGGRVVRSLHFDCLAQTPYSPLNEKALRRAYRAGERLAVRP